MAVSTLWEILFLLYDDAEGDYRAEVDPMHVPARFRDLFYLECRFCHREVTLDDCTREEKKQVRDGRICPSCGVAQSVAAIPQGAPGAWCAFLRWLEEQDEAGPSIEQVESWLDQQTEQAEKARLRSVGTES